MESRNSARATHGAAASPGDSSIPPAALTIRLFGVTDVEIRGEAPQLHSRRAMWLLAILAIRRGRPIERQRLAGMVWPESSDAQALHNLRQTLAGLRRSLGTFGQLIETASPRSMFLRETPEVWVDVVEFDHCCEDGSVASLERGARLYRGPFLAGCDEPFARDERDVRERAFVDMAEHLAAHYVSIQNLGAARDMLRQLLSVDPYRESAFRTLMALLSQSGETAAALDLYRGLRSSLRRDLGMEPDPETTGLCRAIRQGSPANTGSKTARPKAEVRMPSALTPLLGRESEVREVTSLIDRCRLVTLTGVGGVGKTRLAIAVAEVIGDHFVDGVRFVDLAPLQDPARVSSAIAASLEIPEPAGRPVLDHLSEKIRDLSLLVVLDNCEHLSQGVAASLEVLLSASPGLHVLATSRQSTGVAGELIWRVPSLPTPQPIQAGTRPPGEDRFECLASSDSVRLFLDRAGQCGAGALRTEAELEAIGSICRRLDGIPLAIELAAARANVLSAFEIEARLEDRFLLLTRMAGTTARHQTLSATMEWSWDLLTDVERRMLMQLCVFRGGWNLDAAEAVSDLHPEEAGPLDVIARLVDRSMVASSRGPQGIRFTMLETIRQFAASRLRQLPDQGAFYGRHRDYFLELAELAKSKLGEPEETEWFKRLERDHDNLRAAQDWSHASGQHEKGLRLAVALARFWDTHGHLDEGRSRLETSIDQAQTDIPGELLCAAHMHAGWMATVQQDGFAAREHYERALPHYRQNGDRYGTAKVLNGLGVAETHSGDLHRAQNLLREALAIFEDLGVGEAVATVLCNLGDAALTLGENEAARSYLLQSMDSTHGTKKRNSETLGLTFCSLSLVDCRQGMFEEARSSALKALGLFAEAAAFVSVPEALSQMAIVDAAFSNWERVAGLLGASQGLARSQGVPLEEKGAKERLSAEEMARMELGPARFHAAYESGLQMQVEQAIDYALDQTQKG